MRCQRKGAGIAVHRSDCPTFRQSSTSMQVCQVGPLTRIGRSGRFGTMVRCVDRYNLDGRLIENRRRLCGWHCSFQSSHGLESLKFTTNARRRGSWADEPQIFLDPQEITKSAVSDARLVSSETYRFLAKNRTRAQKVALARSVRYTFP